MQNTARLELVSSVLEDFADYHDYHDYHDDRADSECEILEIRSTCRDSLSENFINEIEAWARQALGSNGFGDY